MLAVVFGALVAGCLPSGEGPLLSDPHEILGKTIASTAPLRTVRVRIDAVATSAPLPGDAANGRQDGGWVEADVDLARQEISAHGASRDGSGTFEVILADNALFMKNTSTGRWSKTGMPAGANPVALFGGGLGRGIPDIPTVLAAALSDGSVSTQLKGVEDCPTGRCYHTIVAIPPAMVWQLASKLTGMDRLGPGAAVQPAPGDIPAINLELLTDTKKLWLVDGVASGSLKGNSANVRVQFAKHDEPLVIQPPPPALVDDQGGFGFGFGGAGGGGVVGPIETIGPKAPNASSTPDGTVCTILEKVGSEISPGP
jgi:hypothetical protein